MNAVAISIQHNKYGETETLRVTQFCQYFLVHILFAVIEMIDDIAGMHCGVELFIAIYIFIKPGTPYTPVTTYLNKNMFATCFSFFHCFRQLNRSIFIGLIQREFFYILRMTS